MNKIKINIDINHIARYAHSAKIYSKKIIPTHNKAFDRNSLHPNNTIQMKKNIVTCNILTYLSLSLHNIFTILF